MPGYDTWKLDTPPHYDNDPPECKECGYELNDEGKCKNEDCDLYIEEEGE